MRLSSRSAQLHYKDARRLRVASRVRPAGCRPLGRRGRRSHGCRQQCPGTGHHPRAVRLRALPGGLRGGRRQRRGAEAAEGRPAALPAAGRGGPRRQGQRRSGCSQWARSPACSARLGKRGRQAVVHAAHHRGKPQAPLAHRAAPAERDAAGWAQARAHRIQLHDRRLQKGQSARARSCAVRAHGVGGREGECHHVHRADERGRQARGRRRGPQAVRPDEGAPGAAEQRDVQHADPGVQQGQASHARAGGAPGGAPGKRLRARGEGADEQGTVRRAPGRGGPARGHELRGRGGRGGAGWQP
mmetsp:Transcript_29321/g.78444  ORF Transcript_29321/g.78444 Transcript_29321/m.78444 type:complete len:301 (+) Transcript_29321:151-1053(+)